MKIILTVGLLLIMSTGCKQNSVRTDKVSASAIGTTLYTRQLNDIGTKFMASFQKRNQRDAYRLLDPALRSQISLSDFSRLNATMIEHYGSVTNFQRADKPMRGMRVLPNGQNAEDIAMWFPVKTTQYPSGAIRLKISFNHNARNPKIIHYMFMKPRGG